MCTIWSDGELYEDLRDLAHRHLMRHYPGSLHTTALVHEVYLRLNKTAETAWEDKLHFFSYAAQAMHGVLVDHARAKNALKRGGGAKTLPIHEVGDVEEPRGADPLDILAVHEAIERLKIEHPDLEPLAKLYFFGGLSVPEVVQIAGVEHWKVRLALAYVRGYMK